MGLRLGEGYKVTITLKNFVCESDVDNVNSFEHCRNPPIRSWNRYYIDEPVICLSFFRPEGYRMMRSAGRGLT